jgi:hypothetical protein
VLQRKLATRLAADERAGSKVSKHLAVKVTNVLDYRSFSLGELV